ncbi:MAG: hypothetical protein C5B48_04490 [Candidatus Rokuibacteriota bacterium]|nr:MAG: hypothetical protein C5B48_04490 [Candidatus Rokubacteria bacterium]
MPGSYLAAISSPWSRSHTPLPPLEVDKSAYTRLVPTCTVCGEENSERAKFCLECGAPLAEGPAAPRLEERKVVSVLFCDLVGFTASSEAVDPEDVRARLQPFHALLREEVERHGGTVEKFVGDAVMAAFGAPLAHEDDAERAVRAGLQIVEAIAELNERDPGLDLQVRVGVNTGEAVVAVGARPELGEGFVTGDVVNTASRIQGVAPIDAVAVSEDTYRATSRVFEYEQLEPAAVKGKAEPLELWRAKAARSRFGSDISRRFETPLVGRDLEKPLLIGILERATQQRSCQLVTVVGEPGVGKSRLIAELFAYIEARPGIIRWRQGRCLPYGEGITFWALGEIVKAEAGILESDSVEVAATKLEAVVPPDQQSERQWLLQRLGPLVGVEAASPAERQELFTAWRRFLEGLAASRPSVLVFEDLHWADDALHAFLEHLAEWSEGVPLLVLCAARPELYERRPGWGAGLRNAHTINLSPLSDGETVELVSHLVTTSLGPDLEQAIIHRAGGNPLYAEEFVRLLADRGLDAEQDLLPDSVQALIAARLDTLSPERKSLLQDAAVLGKVFWAGGICEIGGHDPAAVELALHELARKELIRPVRTSSMEGESEYSFWHLLIRDVAYSQIPRAERARRHRAAAGWIERKAGARVEDLAEVLAYHYQQALELTEAAGDAEQATQLAAPARHFLALAGERALGLDTAQAEARLTRALELTPEDDPERSHFLVRWASALFQAGRMREADNALGQALDSPHLRGEPEATALALQLGSRITMRLGRGWQVALAYAAEAVELLERQAPSPALVAAYEQLGHAHVRSGAYAEAVAAADRACAVAAALDLLEPARAMGIRGEARMCLGHPEGIDEMERALTLLNEQGAGWDAASIQNNLALGRYLTGGPGHTLASLEQGIAFGEQRGLVETAAGNDSNCPLPLADLGRTDEALAWAERSVAALEAMELTWFLAEPRAAILAIHLARGEYEELTGGEWLVETARAQGAPDVTVLVLATVAAIAQAEGDNGRACAFLAEVDRAEGANGDPYYARFLASMVRTALAGDEPALATMLVDKLGSRYPLEEHALCACHAQLVEARGDHAEAAALYADAAERWRQFGNVPERGYALLGQGRCLCALGKPDAKESLRIAGELFSSMGYKPALAETETVLGRTAASA